MDMLQSITGQSITQLSPQTISTVASRIADMTRYAPGVSTRQMAQLGTTMRTMLSANGITGLTGIGAANLGSYAAGFLVPGNNAYGVTDQ